APRAKIPRSVARWVRNRASPGPAKSTVCSPTVSPARTEAKPISPSRRGWSLAAAAPEAPAADAHACRPSRSAAASARAAPGGAAEVEGDVGFSERTRQIARDRHVQAPDARRLPGITTEAQAHRRCHRGGDVEARERGRGAQQRLAHAAGDADEGGAHRGRGGGERCCHVTLGPARVTGTGARRAPEKGALARCGLGAARPRPPL